MSNDDFPCTFGTLMSGCCIDFKSFAEHFESHPFRYGVYIDTGAGSDRAREMQSSGA